MIRLLAPWWALVGFSAMMLEAIYRLSHHALALDEADRRPLGIVWSQLWGRAQRSRGRGRNRAGSAFAEQKERESDRWLEGVSEAQAWTAGSERVVHVMDREADSFRLLDEMRRLDASFVVRLRHDRRTASGKLLDVLEGKEIRTRRYVWLSPRAAKSTPRCTYQGRAAREATLEVTAAQVELQPPKYVDAEPLELNVVRIREREAPEGVRPVVSSSRLNRTSSGASKSSFSMSVEIGSTK